MQVKLPPGLLASLPASARLWLELINRDATPASFRVLSKQQAVQLIASRLSDMAANKPADQPQNTSSRHVAQTWSWQDGHPLNAHVSDQGQRLLLDERSNQQPRGMVEREQDEDAFALHGRIDLDQLGHLYFALQQQTGQPARLTLRATQHSSFQQLKQPFANWVQKQSAIDNPITSSLQAELDVGSDPVLKPRSTRSRQI